MAVLVLGSVALGGCQDPDVGQKCSFDGNLATLTAGDVPADYLETGITSCDSLVCIKSPKPPSQVKNNPYCSKVCVSNADCSQSDTGLVCRQVVLDPTFINSLDPAVRQKYLGDTQFAFYCAAPLP